MKDKTTEPILAPDFRCWKCGCKVNLEKARRRYEREVMDWYKPATDTYQCHCGHRFVHLD